MSQVVGAERKELGFPGDFVGLSSNECYAYSAESVTSVTYCRFARRKLTQLLVEFPAVEERPYVLTLTPYGFLWFMLQAPEVEGE